MRYPDYILKVLGAVALIMAASSCVKSDVEYDTSGADISIAPVASTVTRSIPGAITGIGYPSDETMGIFAFHSELSPDQPWPDETSVTPYVYYKEPDKNEDGLPDSEKKDWAAEFGTTQASNNTWGGIFSTLGADGKTLSKQRLPHQWPESGSLIFAGFSPYYKFQAVNTDNLTLDGTLKPMKEMVEFNVEEKALKITGYRVGQYIPMSAEEIEHPDYDHVNKSQSDLLFFMPQVDKDGNYIGVNKLSAYPARFYHALSLVEFTVRAEDDYDIDRIEIDKIKLEEVYHTGNFTARLDDNGKISAEWELSQSHSDVTVFGDDDPETDYLQLTLEPRTVAQLLIIPGPTHRIKVECHVFIKGQMYIQVFYVDPDDVGIKEWLVGKRYVYNLILGLNKITFSSEAKDWNDVRDAITIQ